MYLDENKIYHWKFQPTKKKQDAYENLIAKLNPVSVKDFKTLEGDRQDLIVKEIIQTIRTLNVFPIYYFNEDGIKEEIKKVKDKSISFTDDSLITQASQGLLLLDYLFPNLHLVEAGNNTNNCMYSRFYNDEKLEKCIKRNCKNYKINNMRTPFFMYGRFFWNTATNFSPIRAKAIYEKFCPPNGIIYDYSAGFGGRMLGALSSKNNYTYYCCEPNKNTVYNLQKLGKYIEDTLNRSNSYNIYEGCSEDYIPAQQIDFCFSCPPFFGLERYSTEKTQCYNKYDNYDEWLEEYVRPTIQNCHKCLKKEGLYGVDIMNFTWKNKKYNLVNDWCKIATEEGFIFDKAYPIITRARKQKIDKNTEQIYIFYK